MSLIKWDPFAELNALHEQVNAMFNDTFGVMENDTLRLPTTDVSSTDKSLTMKVHLPGFDNKDVSVQQDGGELVISAEHSDKQEEDGETYIMHESASKYYRRFTLPKNADTVGIKAKLRNGVLRIVVPYKTLPKPKQVLVEK